jgi:hypothetical protein
MDDDFDGGDLEEYIERLGSLLRTTEVMSIYFRRIAHSLIIDFRRTDTIGPRVMTDTSVGSYHDRFLSFGRLRPSFPLPEQLTLVPWHRMVRSFDEFGMLAILRERSMTDTGSALLHEVDDSYLFLLRLERQYLSNMVRGVGMRTLWERARG